MKFELGLTKRFTGSVDLSNTWHEFFLKALINAKQTEMQNGATLF